MRFMILRKADKNTEADDLPDENLITAMERYIEELTKAGVMRAGEGLHPSRSGARIKFSGGRPTVIDGPFAETKELIAGFSIFEVKSKEEAIEWVKRWPAADGDGEVEIEIRQVYEASDFGIAAPPELREAQELMRQHLLNGPPQVGATK